MKAIYRVCAVTVIALSVGIGSATPAATATINDVQINRLTWNGSTSEYGEVVVDLTLGTAQEYVNVLADLNGSGGYADYPAGPERIFHVSRVYDC